MKNREAQLPECARFIRLGVFAYGNDIYQVDNIGDVVVAEAGEGFDQIRSSVIDFDLANYANVENLRLLSSADLALTGKHTFVFNDVAETGATGATRDKITDFSQGQGDLIDLSVIDAVIAPPGNQAFTFIGTSEFSSFYAQLRYEQSGNITIIQGDIDGDGVKDFEIFLNGLVDLTAGDFVL